MALKAKPPKHPLARTSAPIEKVGAQVSAAMPNQGPNNALAQSVDKDGKVTISNPQQFFNVIMTAAREMIVQESVGLKRDIEDLKIANKILRRRIVDIELEFKCLGIAIGQLGIAEINLLNDTKNTLRDKLGVVMSNGQIRGRTDVSRYNMIPATKSVSVRVN